MPVETTNRFYTSFSQIGIGDKVTYLSINYQVMIRLDKDMKVTLVNHMGRLSTYNWEQLEIIDLMNEWLLFYLFRGAKRSHKTVSNVHSIFAPIHYNRNINQSGTYMKTTKVEAIQQFKYNWKVYTLRCKRENKRVTKLAKVFAWNDYTEFLAQDGYITENQRVNWTNPYEFRN